MDNNNTENIVINSEFLEMLESLGYGADADGIEQYVARLQDAAADGEEEVANPVYDKFVEILRVLKPDSEILRRNWEQDAPNAEFNRDDYFLKRYGMRSIKTCTCDEDVEKKSEILVSRGVRYTDLLASFKLNGHAGRVTYCYGKLSSGTPRGRYKKGRDITRHMKGICPNYIELLAPYPIVEIRGELIVSYDTFNNVTSKWCKTPLSSVTSLVRDSVTDSELQNLEFIAYKAFIYADDGEETELNLELDSDDTVESSIFDTLEEEYQFLSACGFKIPNYRIYRRVDISDLVNFVNNTVLEEFSSETIAMNYDTDGIVIGINNNKVFYGLGLDETGHFFLANMAIKMGNWQCNQYKGIVQRIVWERGKRWFTPKAEIEKVITALGSAVTTVPLYNVGVLTKLNIKKGSTIHFRYGGETGVQLLTPDGKSVTTI